MATLFSWKDKERGRKKREDEEKEEGGNSQEDSRPSAVERGRRKGKGGKEGGKSHKNLRVLKILFFRRRKKGEGGVPYPTFFCSRGERRKEKGGEEKKPVCRGFS